MSKQCAIDGCSGLGNSRGMCRKHYREWYKQQTGPVRRPGLEERFWRLVDRTEVCWLWLGHRSGRGYGNVSVNGKTRLAHRVAFELAIGPIEDGLQIDHLCRNPSCVNPEHLEAVSPRVNVMRSQGVAAINAEKTHCVNGHALDEANTYKLSNGGRKCKRCTTENSRRYREERKAA